MVDLSFLEKFTNGNENKMKRYIKLYLGIAPETFDKMEESIMENDWERLRINAHSLKPQSDYMGIPKLKAVLVQIENDANKGNQSELQEQFLRAKKLHLMSTVILEEFLNRETNS